MLLLQIVATMQVFIEPYLLTGGGPENATVTVAYLMYQYAFNFGDFGGGSALGLMLMIVLMVFSTIYLRVSRDNTVFGAKVAGWPPGRVPCWASWMLSRAAAATASAVMPNWRYRVW